MEKNTKIFIYLFILAILFLLAFLGIIIKDHYNNGKNTPANTTQETPLSQTPANIEVSPSSTLIETITPTPEDTSLDTPIAKELHLEIKKDDCKNECANFKKNSTDLRYCQEVCGLIEVKKESSLEECKKKEGLESDYCLRDLAISQKDYKICNEIKDANITKNCQNRITEDIFEQQNN